MHISVIEKRAPGQGGEGISKQFYFSLDNITLKDAEIPTYIDRSGYNDLIMYRLPVIGKKANLFNTLHAFNTLMDRIDSNDWTTWFQVCNLLWFKSRSNVDIRPFPLETIENLEKAGFFEEDKQFTYDEIYSYFPSENRMKTYFNELPETEEQNRSKLIDIPLSAINTKIREKYTNTDIQPQNVDVISENINFQTENKVYVVQILQSNGKYAYNVFQEEENVNNAIPLKEINQITSMVTGIPKVPNKTNLLDYIIPLLGFVLLIMKD